MTAAARKKLMVMGVALIIVVCLCAGASLGTVAAMQRGAQLPIVYDLPLLSSIGVLAHDDFHSEQRSQALGWDFGANESINHRWSPNGLDMEFTKQQSGELALLNQVVRDFGVMVEAQPEDNPGIEYGIAFRYTLGQDRSSYYLFMARTDGKYYLWKKVDGKWWYKRPVNLTATPLLKPGASVNRLGVLAEGSTITLYINGSVAKTFRDDALTSGTVGVVAINGPNAPAHLTFTRLTLYSVERARLELGKR